jgi:hypothetical protein
MAKKAIRLLKVKTGLAVAKLYLPSASLTIAGATAILTSHNIMKRRNAVLTAAYTALETAFSDYRGRVIDRFGEEVDRELKYNMVHKTVEEEVETESGKKKKVKKEVDVVGENLPSIYAKFFDSSSREFQNDPESNLFFLTNQQNYFNDLLKSRAKINGGVGHVFLNEVYDRLDIPRTSTGQICGWVLDFNDAENNTGDGVIDFGIYQTNRANRRFVNGLESVILLDFNCDGSIIDKI